MDEFRFESPFPHLPGNAKYRVLYGIVPIAQCTHTRITNCRGAGVSVSSKKNAKVRNDGRNIACVHSVRHLR